MKEHQILFQIRQRLEIRTFIIGIILIPLTALSIYVIYGNYLFSKWPWMRFSLVMAVLTCLWTHTFWFYHLAKGEEDPQMNPLFFAMAIIPFDALLMYPGTKTLEIHSDKYFLYLILLLEIIHGLGFYFIPL